MAAALCSQPWAAASRQYDCRRRHAIVCQAQQSGAPRPAKPTGKRRGKALLQDVALKPGERGDALLEQIANDLRPEAVALVQWYPGHIAKAERDLREQLKAVDLVLEVRDGRCPMSTRHPQIPEWVGSRPRLLLVNRKDMVGEAERAAWSRFFSERGSPVVWTCGNMGDGLARVQQAADALGAQLNAKRQARGLRPRPVRAVVIGFPNVGKSALINRLLGRRAADSAPKPGVTRQLRWARCGGEGSIDLLDAPGIIPMNLRDQTAAQRLAMCNDIGEASYVDSLIAAEFLETVRALPSAPAILRRLRERYKLDLGDYQGEEYVHALGARMFNDEPERAGQRILKDFRTLALGRICLEMPRQYANVREV